MAKIREARYSVPLLLLLLLQRATELPHMKCIPPEGLLLEFL